MPRRLLYKFVDRQEKCDEVGNRESRGRSANHSFERLVSLMGRAILYLQRLLDFRNVHAATRRCWERPRR
jgi:hypothetical protein